MRTFRLAAACFALAATQAKPADPAWKSKPAAQWTEEDAAQLLAASPWSRQIKATITRRLTEDQLREGGQMGQPRGVGNEGVDPKSSGPKLSPDVFTSRGNEIGARSLPQPIILNLRWESALPVRLAELKARENEPPTLEGDGYRIAVYGIPLGGDFKGDPKKLGEPLKNLAALKRDGKKDVRPVRVEVFLRDNDVAVVYLFPLSAEITRNDRLIQFDAHIGRIVVTQTFDVHEMEFQGKLEL